ncbi:MAG: histidinol dehydrogenase [Deltaproteobacteria bacterium]|nr:histidinol dehydrogenase [Deltaproteobacteria bacterium]
MDTKSAKFRKALKTIIQRRDEKEERFEGPVQQIIRNVRRNGDLALTRYARKFDGVALKPSQIEVKPREMDSAVKRISKEDLRALQFAARRIARFHRRQLEKSWRYRDPMGMVLGQNMNPLERAGVYVPGGKACYPSSVLMNVIPARVAGVKEVIMTSPLGASEVPILAAARVAEVDRVFRVGGAQAIAAMAYGTKTIPKVDKIVGPGNIFVATAKRLVFGQVGIDSIAGPSEVLLLVDSSADPAYVAADMLSQAEHDEMAAALCVTSSRAMGLKVKAALEKQIKETKRRAITLKALERFGAIIVARGLSEGVDLVNAIAPEHVEVITHNARKWADSIRNAGAIFVGPYTTPALGDYVAGPNHVLPTGGRARFFSPLGTYDFVKRTSFIESNRKGVTSLASWITRLARLEGLDEHARAVELRMEK